MNIGDKVEDKRYNRIGVVEQIANDDDGCILWVRWGNNNVLNPCFARYVTRVEE
jgi:hypothetical protein